jgi:cytochrome c oxidase subunit 3
MFFVAWFWAYFDISLFPNEFVGNVWPPKDIETFDPWDIPLINTFVLLIIRNNCNLVSSRTS